MKKAPNSLITDKYHSMGSSRKQSLSQELVCRWFILESEMFNCGNREPGKMKHGKKTSQHNGVTTVGR